MAQAGKRKGRTLARRTLEEEEKEDTNAQRNPVEQETRDPMAAVGSAIHPTCTTTARMDGQDGQGSDDSRPSLLGSIPRRRQRGRLSHGV